MTCRFGEPNSFHKNKSRTRLECRDGVGLFGVSYVSIGWVESPLDFSYCQISQFDLVHLIIR